MPKNQDIHEDLRFDKIVRPYKCEKNKLSFLTSIAFRT